jgi:hypothetical protein
MRCQPQRDALISAIQAGRAGAVGAEPACALATRARAACAVAACVLATCALAACGGTQSPTAASGTASPGTANPGTASPGTAKPSTAGSATATASTASSPVCATAALRIRLTHTGALGGQAGGYLTFTNTGSAACRLTGWPAVHGLTATGQGPEFGHARSTMFGAWQYQAPMPVVLIQPGQSGYAVVVGDDHPAGSATSCPAPYRRLSVTPPGSTRSVVISAWLPGAISYLPTCASIRSAPTDQVSVIVPLASLPH